MTFKGVTANQLITIRDINLEKQNKLYAEANMSANHKHIAYTINDVFAHVETEL